MPCVCECVWFVSSNFTLLHRVALSNEIALLLRNDCNDSHLVLGKVGAGDGNRTRVASLEGWSFTTKQHPLYRKMCFYTSTGVDCTQSTGILAKAMVSGKDHNR